MPKISDERRAQRREQIVSAAMRCAIRSGLDGMTMASVIEESGLSAGAVYGYFSGKAELISAVVDVPLGTLEALLEGAATQEDVPEIPDVLGRFAEGIIRLANGENGDLTVAVLQGMADAARGGATLGLVRPRIEGLIGRWVTIVERRQDAGLLDSEADPLKLAQTLHSAVLGFLVLRLVYRDLSPADVRASWQAIIGDLPSKDAPDSAV
ncbi:TetR/AcrR family transcriptional regulator [Flexivirga sp. B27]